MHAGRYATKIPAGGSSSIDLTFHAKKYVEQAQRDPAPRRQSGTSAAAPASTTLLSNIPVPSATGPASAAGQADTGLVGGTGAVVGASTGSDRKKSGYTRRKKWQKRELTEAEHASHDVAHDVVSCTWWAGLDVVGLSYWMQQASLTCQCSPIYLRRSPIFSVACLLHVLLF